MNRLALVSIAFAAISVGIRALPAYGEAPAFELQLGPNSNQTLIRTPKERLGRMGSELRFLGFSKNSRYIAYTRGSIGSQKPPEQRMHRRLKYGEFSGFGEKVGLDVARFAQREGYRIESLPYEIISSKEVLFDLDNRALLLRLDLGSRLGWTLENDQGVVSTHTFDRIYVGFDVELFVAPNRQQGVLVMHLDTGWEIDAAIFPVWLSDEAKPKTKETKKKSATSRKRNKN